MIANVYTGGYHYRLDVTVEDLEELIMRCGWTVVDQIEGLTPAAKERIEFLHSRPSVQSVFDGVGSEAALAWWKRRVLSKEPAVTPDM